MTTIRIYSKISLFAVFILALISCTEQASPKLSSPNLERATPEKAYLQDYERTQDPALGHPTPERLLTALKEIRNQKLKKSVPGDTNEPWVERGPSNVGGRTRAIMFDPNDPTHKKVWAGGVTGGLWYNDDITSSGSKWVAVNDFWSNLSITSIAADPNNSQIFYVGTGESFTGSSRGSGIWKTTDGGTTWNQIQGSASFYYVNDIVVRNESGQSVIYAGVTGRYYSGNWHGATETGLQRSTDGGSNWTQVLPNIPGETMPAAASDLELDAANNLWVGTDASPFGANSDRGGGKIYRSSNGTSFTLSYSSSVTYGYGRVELACAPSNANYVYAIIEDQNVVHEMVRTTNGGSNWSNISEPVDVDNGIPNSDFTRGQAFYDLIAAVSPANENHLIVGGIDLFHSTDGGNNWSQISKWSNNNNLANLNCSKVHADQHQVVFRPGSANEVLFGNDGGVYYCSDLSSAAISNVVQPRNNNYNVTQFYAAAMHPGQGEDFYLAGSQDNGTQLFNKFGNGSTMEATGGDGAFCFVDQNEPDTIITSYVFNNYYLSTDGGQTFTTLVASNTGAFINPAAYDSEQNLLYSAFDASSIYRTDLTGSTTSVNLGLNARASAFAVSPHTTNSTTLFVGTGNAGLYKVKNADNSFTVNNISSPSFSGSISSIAIGGSEDTLAVTFFNYGVNSIWYTTDGGSTWSSKEGNLPDMPVRWFLFNPNNKDEAIIATELGVWKTSDFTAASPQWQSSNEGLANVRVDMLQMRESDGQVIAATHGRGLYSNDAFANRGPKSDFAASTEKAGIEMPVQLHDKTSGNPKAWSWSFSPENVIFLEGTNADSQHPIVQFTESGNYDVTLTTTNPAGTNTSTKAGYITVANAKAVPYAQDFDNFSTCSVSNNCNLVCSLSEDWQNASSELDYSDWITWSGNTYTNKTGPSGDNTSGPGKYLYVEADGCIKKEVILYSPVFDLRNAENPQLNFAYHMFGVYAENLELFVYDQKEWQPLWSHSGNDGNSWQNATVDLSAYTGKQIVVQIKAVTGSYWTSDIAIDDFEISETSIRWDGGGSTNNWSDANNWSNDQVPQEGAYVILDNTFVPGDYSINLLVPQQVASIDVDMGSNAVSLSGKFELAVSSVVYPSSGTLNTHGQLRLKSLSEVQYGQVATGSGTISGNVINEWYFDGRDGYRHIASPVSGPLSEIDNDFSRLVFGGGGAGSIWSWDPTVSEWSYPGSASDLFDEAFSVYLGSASGLEFSPLSFVFDASGPLNSGSIGQPLTYSTGDPADFVDPNQNSGWNFLANPYPSILDWDLVTSDAQFPAELSQTVYYWDESLNSDGGYASYNPVSGGLKGGTPNIAKGQAVWLQLASAPAGNSTTLMLKDIMRTTRSAPKLKNAAKVSNTIVVTAAQKGQLDEVRISELANSTPAYDHLYDHLEMDNGEYGFSLFQNAPDRKLAYNCLPRYEYPISLTFQTQEEGASKISVKVESGFSGEKPRFIKDLSSGEIHDLSNGSYSFYASAGQPQEFLLLHRKDDDQPREETISVGSGNGVISLRYSGYQNYSEALLFDLSGKLILKQELDPGLRYEEVSVNKNGIFILHLQGEDGKSHSQKVMLNR